MASTIVESADEFIKNLIEKDTYAGNKLEKWLIERRHRGIPADESFDIPKNFSKSEKIILGLFQNGKVYSRKEIQDKTGLAKNTVSWKLKQLCISGTVSQEKEKRICKNGIVKKVYVYKVRK